MKIAFLILHYKNIKETIECVESILKNVNYDNYNIIIVDNGSNNNTGEHLKERYKNNKKVKVIINKENLGFAKGNNIGFSYIKNNLHSDFIVMINSDTIIKQREFCEKLISKYNELKFHIAGPDIISNDGKHVNPVNVTCKNVEDLKKMIRLKKIQIALCRYKMEFLNIMVSKFKNKFNNVRNIKDEYFQIHGAAIIFSPLYINMYNGLYDGTFLYFEETILRYICDRDKLKMSYLKDLQVIHKESKTTKSLFRNISKRHMFYYVNSLNSCIALLNLINQDKNTTWKE